MSRIGIPRLDAAARHDLRAYRLPDGRLMDLFAVLTHYPPALRDLRQATALALHEIDLPVRTRELVILRTLARSGAEAEWALHVRLFALVAKLSDEEIAATATCGSYAWAPPDARLIAVADACHDADGVVSDAVWDGLLDDGLSTGQLVGLLNIIGQYRKVALLTNALRLVPTAGLPRFPAQP